MIRLSDAAQLFHADCRDAIKALPDNSLDSCVTDPPYALVSTVKRFANSPRTEASMPTAGPYERASRGFMGQKWDTGETAFSTEFWAEVYRVLKPGAFVAAFGASRQYHRMACAIEDAGFEIRDSLMWVYGTGFPKSHDVSKGVDRIVGGVRETRRVDASDLKNPPNLVGGAVKGDDRPWRLAAMEKGYHEVAGDIPATPAAQEWEGWGTALKPAFEPIVLARKPLSEPTVAANVLKWRTGALNIGASRVPTAPGDYSTGGKNEGIGVRQTEGQKHERTEQHEGGRWPANVVTDGSDEVVGCFPYTKSGSIETHHKRAGKGLQGTSTFAIRDRTGEPGFAGSEGSAARFFYSAKASKADRNGSKHPTVKPIALMEWLCTLITPPGGTVLDPFAGSGTTGIAATRRGFQVVLCEREAEYVADIKARFPGATVDIQRLPVLPAPPLAPLAPCPLPALAPPPY